MPFDLFLFCIIEQDLFEWSLLFLMHQMHQLNQLIKSEIIKSEKKSCLFQNNEL